MRHMIASPCLYTCLKSYRDKLHNTCLTLLKCLSDMPCIAGLNSKNFMFITRKKFATGNIITKFIMSTKRKYSDFFEKQKDSLQQMAENSVNIIKYYTFLSGVTFIPFFSIQLRYNDKTGLIRVIKELKKH